MVLFHLCSPENDSLGIMSQLNQQRMLERILHLDFTRKTILSHDFQKPKK